MDFTHYYGRHKTQNKTAAQTPVPQSKRFVIRARIDEQLLRRIRSCGMKEGQLIRAAIVNYFNKQDEDAWQKEVAEW